MVEQELADTNETLSEEKAQRAMIDAARLAAHLSLIVSPKTAIWGEKLRNLPLIYDS